MSEEQQAPRYEREESRAETLDRNWNELLQEIRVLQTGSQILAAFLVVLPFQARFPELDAFQTALYLGLLLLALVIVALLLTPVSLHRQLFRRRLKDRMVHTVGVLVQVALLLLGLLLVAVAVFVLDVVVSRGAALAAGAGLAVLLVVLQVALPRGLAPRREG